MAEKKKTNYKYTIEEIAISLIQKNRFYATILSKCTKVATKLLPTAAVGFNKHGKLSLFYNEEFLLGSMTLKEAQGVLIHESLHIFFRHLFRMKTEFEENKELANIAADMAINQHISPELLWKKPEPIMPEMFKQEKDKAAEFYYENMKKDQKPQKDKGKGKGKGKPEKGTGEKGDGENQDSSGQPQTIDDHSMWDKVIDQDANGNEVMKNADELDIDIEYEVQQAVVKSIKECRDYGKLPAFVEKEIERMKKKEGANWKHELRVFVQSVMSRSKRFTVRKQNRRLFPTWILPGKKKGKRPQIILARDTSGSVFCDSVQEMFLAEMINISKYCDMYVIDCDAVIHQMYQVRKVQDFKSYKGGGGTAFEPVFERAKQIAADGIIYLTDTYGSFPNKDDIGKFASKTIWVTFGQKEVSVPFGKHLNIEDEKE